MRFLAVHSVMATHGHRGAPHADSGITAATRITSGSITSSRPHASSEGTISPAVRDPRSSAPPPRFAGRTALCGARDALLLRHPHAYRAE